MIIWGWSGMAHDASLAVFKKTKKGLGTKSTTELLFAAHSERYSRIKNDKNLHLGLLTMLFNSASLARYIITKSHYLKKHANYGLGNTTYLAKNHLLGICVTSIQKHLTALHVVII